MKTRVSSRLTIFLLAVGVGAALVHAEEQKVNFDQGVDAHAALEDARNSGQAASLPAQSRPSKQPKLCSVNFKSNMITLEPGINYARAEYKLDENCQPLLTSIVYLSDAPMVPKTRLDHGRDGRFADSTFAGIRRSTAKSSSATCAMAPSRLLLKIEKRNLWLKKKDNHAS